MPDIDASTDARVDDFADEDDPAWTGWHRLEYLLWEVGDISGAGPIADQLDADLARLQREFPDTAIPPAALAAGAADLIEEVSEGKITGEEDRYSHTDISDFDANVAGAEQIVELLTPALREAAQLRLAHPDETLAELGRRCTPPVGKATFNGRLVSLMRLVKRLRGEREEPEVSHV